MTAHVADVGALRCRRQAETLDQRDVHARGAEAGAGDRDQVGDAAGGETALLQGRPRGLEGQRPGVLCILVQTLAGRRAPVVRGAAGQEDGARCPRAVQEVLHHVLAQDEMAALHARIVVDALQPGGLFLGAAAEVPGHALALLLRNGRRWHGCPQAQDSDVHADFILVKKCYFLGLSNRCSPIRRRKH